MAQKQGTSAEMGNSGSQWEEQRFLSWKGDSVCVMEGWNSESIQNPGSARGILELNPEHSWADHSVPVVSGESPEPLCPQCCPQLQRGKFSGVTAR